MTENKIFVSGILVMMLALGLTFIGCDTDGGGGGDPYDGPKTIKITGFDLDIPNIIHNKTGVTGKYLYIEVWEGEIWKSSKLAEGEVINPSGQNITFELLNNDQPWTGTGSYYIVIQGPPKNVINGDHGDYFYSVNGINAVSVDIFSAITTLKWSNFIWVSDGTFG